MTEELRVVITAEVDKLRQEINKGKKEVEDFSKKGKEKFKEFNDAVQKVGDVSKKALTVTAGAIAGAATALLALGASTEEYRVAQAKLNTTFEMLGSSADTAKQTYNDLYRVLGDSDVAVEAANHLAVLTTDQKQLSEWTKICQGVYATFGDSLPIEGLTEAANETARVGQLTGPLTDAINWATMAGETFGVKLKANTKANKEWNDAVKAATTAEDFFNLALQDCANTAEREKLIRETLNGLYSDAAEGYEENAAEILAQNEAQAKLNETTAELGEAMAPLNTMLNEFATSVLAELTPHIQAFAEEHGPAIKAALEEIATAIGNVLSWVIDNWEMVSTIGTIVLGIAAALSVFSTVMGIVNAVMAPHALIILGIVAAVAALVAIIVLCVKYWDEIKEAAGKALDFIQEKWNIIADWFNTKIVEPIKNLFTGLWENIVDGYNAVIAPWIEIIKRIAIIINETVIVPIKNFFGEMWEKLTSGASKAWEGIKKVFSPIINWFKDQFTKAWTAVKNVFSTGGKIFDGIKDGIVSVFKTVVNAIIGGINKVIAVPFNAINKMLAKLKGIEIVGVKPFNWIKTFTVPEIPKLAKGGVVDSATLAMIGEQGREMVMPLENNLEYLDKLATLITERMGGGNRPVVLNVDGKVFAQTSINTINELTRQTGSLKLNIV